MKHLRMQKLIPATPERVFRAWTNPEELVNWWGPVGVRCVSAEVDLRQGGQYSIANELPDGAILWIRGEFETVEEPTLLIYTWVVETTEAETERVTVRFEAHDSGTQLVLMHEQIPGEELRDQHRHGWEDCLNGLLAHLSGN